MEIYYNTKIGFKFLTEGSTFLYDNKLCMKIQTGKVEDLVNAVNLEDGELYYIDPDESIIKTKSKIEVIISNLND